MTKSQNYFIFAFRFLMGWTFLYAASHQVGNDKFTTAGFLSNTKTFHDVYAAFTGPTLDPILTFLVSYGHLLIGLSLLFGLLVRASSLFAILLMLLYWTAHMDWPFIENHNNFVIDYHIVYATICLFLFATRAGHSFGLDAIAARLSAVKSIPWLYALIR